MEIPRLLQAVILNILLLAVSSSAFATANTWKTTGTTANWNLAGNWSRNAVLVAADTLTFGAASGSGTNLTNDLTGYSNSGGITFSAGAPSYTLTGNAITSTGNSITNNSTNLQTIGFDISVSTIRTFNLTAGGGDIALNGNISGAGGISTAGTGKLYLNGTNNTWSTGKTVTIGTGTTIILGAGANVPSGDSLTADTGGIFDINGNNQTLGQLITSNGTVTNSSSTTATFTFGQGSVSSGAGNFSGKMNVIYNTNAASLGTWTGNWTNTGNITLTCTGASGITLSTGTVNNTGTITNTTANASLITISASIGSKVQMITQNGGASNKFIISGSTNAAFIGDTTVTSGILNLQTTNALQNSVVNVNGGSVTFGTSATVGLSSVAFGGLAGSVNVALQDTLTIPAAVALTIGNSNASYAGNTLNPTYSGNLTGSGSVTKTGSNTQTLTGTNAYTGTTTVTSGTLLVSGTGTINTTSGVSITGGALDYQNNTTGLNRNITLNGGTFRNNSTQSYTGTLTFTSGTVGGTNLSGVALAIGTGQTISPGNSPGTLTTDAETWTGGGKYVWEINNATGVQGTNWDFISSSGALIISSLTPSSTFNIDILGLTAGNVSGAVPNWSNTNRSWKIATFSSITGTFAANLFNVDTSGLTNNNTAPGTFEVSNIGSDLYLTYAVPEPATWGLLAFSMTTVMVLRRQKRG